MSLTVINQSPDDVTISYFNNNTLQEEDIPKGSVGSISTLSAPVSFQPADVVFKAFKKGTSTIVKINGTDSIKVTPTIGEINIPVYIGEGTFGFDSELLFRTKLYPPSPAEREYLRILTHA